MSGIDVVNSAALDGPASTNLREHAATLLQGLRHEMEQCAGALLQYQV